MQRKPIRESVTKILIVWVLIVCGISKLEIMSDLCNLFFPFFPVFSMMNTYYCFQPRGNNGFSKKVLSLGGRPILQSPLAAQS